VIATGVIEVPDRAVWDGLRVEPAMTVTRLGRIAGQARNDSNSTVTNCGVKPAMTVTRLGRIAGQARNDSRIANSQHASASGCAIMAAWATSGWRNAPKRPECSKTASKPEKTPSTKRPKPLSNSNGPSSDNAAPPRSNSKCKATAASEGPALT